MKYLIKYVAIIAALVLIVGVIGIGCAGAAEQTAAEQTAAEQTAAEETEKAAVTVGEATEEETTAEEAVEGEFNWKQFEGTTIKLLGVAGTYNLEIQESIKPFTELTGIEVITDFVPETDYYNKVQLVAASGSGEYDFYMVGFPNMIDWVPAGWLEPLDKYVNDPNLTTADWDFEDFYPAVIENCYWDGINGHKFGKTGDAELWVIPEGVQLNGLLYRKDIFEKHSLEPPKTVKEAIEVGEVIMEKEPGMYGIGMRGKKEMATLYGGLWQTLMSYGATDFDDDLNSLWNSPEMVAGITEVQELLNKTANMGTWANQTWYEGLTDLAQGRVAMIDAAWAKMFYINYAEEDYMAKKKIAMAPPIYGTTPENMVSSMWCWSLGISSAAKNKEAAWMFIMFNTSKQQQREGTLLAYPSRASVFSSTEFAEGIDELCGPGNNVIESWNATAPYGAFIFTPVIGYNDFGNVFVGELQNAILGTKTPQKAMDDAVKYYDDNYKNQ